MPQTKPLDAATLDALRAAICNLIPQWPKAELEDFRYLPCGYSNDNYRFCCRGEDYVLRVPLNRKRVADWQQERAFYQAPGDVLIPDLVAMDTSTGTMICQWAQGQLLSDANPSNARLVAYTKHLHKTLGAHAHAFAHRHNPIDLGHAQLAVASQRVPAAVNAHMLGLKWEPAQTTLCHNDLNPWNVIAATQDVGAWVTLDWECPGHNDPVFDLVTLHQGLERDMSDVQSLAEQLLEADVSPQRVDGNLQGFWLREYCWAFATWHQGNRREAIAAQMHLAETKLAALSA